MRSGGGCLEPQIAEAAQQTLVRSSMSNLKFNNRFDAAIFLTIALILLALVILLISNLVLQYLNYNEAIKVALDNSKSTDYASVLSFSRAWDFAVVKTSALFLSFLLIFSGALYVIRTGETNFEVKAENADFKGSLSLSSPGLVMVTLGTILTAYVLSTRTYIEYNPQGSQAHYVTDQKPNSIPIEPGTYERRQK